MDELTSPPGEGQPTVVKKARRSAVERIVVWGVIATLAVFTVSEWYSRRCYHESFTAVEQLLEEAHARQERALAELAGRIPGRRLTLDQFRAASRGQQTLSVTPADVEKSIRGYPLRSVSAEQRAGSQFTRVETYRWLGFSNYTLHVNYVGDSERYLFSIQTGVDDAP